MLFSFIQLLANASLLLAQTERQKTQTIISVCLLALLVALFVLDIFAKNKFAGKTPLKKIILAIGMIVAIVLVLVLIFYK